MKRSLYLFLILLLATFSAYAGPYYEIPDAGSLLTSAQMLPGGTSVVYGTLGDDVDLFGFGWGGGAFYVNSVGTPWDSQLFLFDSTGRGVQGNDDGISFAGPAYLQLSSLAAGTYYLGISAFDLDPYSAGGIMFQSYPYGALYGPSNDDPLISWGGPSYASGDYTINFGQTTGEGEQHDPNPTGGVVPEPGSMLLLGTGLLGALRFVRRRP